MPSITKVSEIPVNRTMSDALARLGDLPASDALTRISHLPVGDVFDRLAEIQLHDALSEFAESAVDSVSQVVDSASDLAPPASEFVRRRSSRSSGGLPTKLLVGVLAVGAVVGALALWRRRAASAPTTEASTTEASAPGG